MKPRLTRIAHVALFVRDPPAAAQWYCETLGLTVIAETPDDFGIFLSFGEEHHNVALIKAEKDAEQGQLGLQHVAFEIDGDMDELRRLYGMLLEKNVTIVKITDHTIGKGIYFEDPDGNRLEFFCNLLDGEEGRRVFKDAQAPSAPMELDPIY